MIFRVALTVFSVTAAFAAKLGAESGALQQDAPGQM